MSDGKPQTSTQGYSDLWAEMWTVDDDYYNALY